MYAQSVRVMGHACRSCEEQWYMIRIRLQHGQRAKKEKGVRMQSSKFYVVTLSYSVNYWYIWITVKDTGIRQPLSTPNGNCPGKRSKMDTSLSLSN